MPGMRPGPATSSPPCCPSTSGSWALSTATPWPPATTSLLDRGGGGCGRGPRPVRRPAAHLRADQGPEHPDTLTTRYNLARWTGEAGDAAGARDQFAALLPIRERVLGPEHPDTLATRHDLARWTGEAGDAAGARDQFAALLPVRERIQGPEHPDTLTACANLAYWTGQADIDGTRSGS